MIEGPIQTNNSGLVFYFDAKEPKSYAGKPTTNYLTTALTPNSATKESFTGAITENSIIAPDGTLTAHRFQVTSGYVYQTLTIPVGTTVTYSVWIKTLDVVSATSYGPYIWNYNAPTYGIVARDLSGVGLDWKRMSMTYTTLSHQSSFAISYAATNGGMQGLYALWRPQLEYSSSATPFVNGARSNTQGLLDLIEGSTIDLTNAGYNGSSEITFNGSSSRLTSANAIFNRTSGQEITVACWMKPSRNAGQYQIIAENRSSDASLYNWILYQHTTDGAISFHGISQNKSSYVPTLNQWIYVANTVTSAGVSTLYTNGTSVYVVTGYTYGNSNTPSLLCVGGDGNGAECIQGNIDTVAVYNRALSAAEILKNFNSQRSRYNV